MSRINVVIDRFGQPVYYCTDKYIPECSRYGSDLEVDEFAKADLNLAAKLISSRKAMFISDIYGNSFSLPMRVKADLINQFIKKNKDVLTESQINSLEEFKFQDPLESETSTIEHFRLDPNFKDIDLHIFSTYNSLADIDNPDKLYSYVYSELKREDSTLEFLLPLNDTY